MAKKNVIVYYMHESEQAEALDRLENPTWTNSYGMGAMTETDIEALEDRGILVEVLDQRATKERSTAADDDLDLNRGPSEAVAMSGAPSAPTASSLPGVPRSISLPGVPRSASLHPTKDNVFVIEIEGPFLMPAWQDNLDREGVTILERLPDGRYTAYLTLAQLTPVKQLSFVVSVRLFAPDDDAGAMFNDVASFGLEALGNAEPVELHHFDVMLHRPEDKEDVEQWLADHNVTLVASGRRKLRVALPANNPLVREIEALPEVRQIAQYVPPTLANQVARTLLGVDPDPAVGGASLAQTGAGEIVAVADSGMDDAHPDFSGRVVGLVDRAATGNTLDGHGHGTHVAGSVLGDGTASNGDHKGTAPGAQLFFQKIMDDQDRLTGLPVELGDLFEEAYQAGARIHNNSWSADTKSFYTFNALEVDEFVEQHPDLLVTIAAGNEASAADPFSAAPGFVDWQSIGSPATAKNALTVGACRNARSEGGRATRTYKQFNPHRFPDPPIANQTVSGDRECMAAFSARGPCDPRRIKPDVVAPGTDILSTRASTASTDRFWGLLAGNDHYAYLGGTSMATPLVSGCAALAREFYRNEHDHEPSAALVKATLVNSTRRLSGADATADHDKLPNFHQGFGAVYMPHALPNPRESWLKLAFLDTWKRGERFVPGGRDRLRLAFSVQGGAFLRICLTWTDPAAGASLQNILGVILEHQGLTPPKRMGNQDRPNPVGRLDRDNNVQIIRIENPPAGNYLLQIFSANLLLPQDWALVVTGDVAGGLTEI